MACLKVLKGDRSHERVSLDADKIVLGRNPDCQVVINGTAVSRAHAQILRVDGRYYIEDLHSRNKTLVNGKELAPDTQVLLRDQDCIKICDFMAAFQDEPAKPPLPEALRPEEEEEEPGDDSTATIEATVANVGSHVLLETQPTDKVAALLDIATNLSKTLELDSLLPKIADNLFLLFKQADRCFIVLQEEVSKKLMTKVVKTRRATDEQNARFSRKIVNQCLDTVQALLSDDASMDSRFKESQSIADFRIRSVMCAPLWTQEGKGVGVIQLDTQDRGKKFSQDDLKLLMGVASQASVAVENAKLHADLVARERLKRDLELARQVQRGFLPRHPPAIDGYEFYAFYESAQEVGGDYFDFVPMPGGRWAVMLGDVAGKGVPAALLMAKISSDARFCVLTEPSPDRAVTRLNAQMHEAGLTERFVTFVACVLDPAENAVTLVNAGHPSPLIYRAATGKLEEASSAELTGLPIGILEGVEYVSCRLALAPGDAVLIFSDGVTEAMDRDNGQFQVEGIHAAATGGPSSPNSLGERVVEAVRKHATGRSQHDDITLVCFGRTGGAA